MVSSSRWQRSGRPAVAAIVALSIGLMGLGTVHAAPEPGRPASKPGGTPARTGHKVTLISGDRVTVAGDGKVAIEPGPGRQRMVFQSYRHEGRLTVIPADMLASVRTGRVDRRLFEVTGLIEAGYDDARSRTTPLIVTYAGRAQRPRLAGVTRELPVVNGVAVKVPKKTTGAFLRQHRSAGVAKIWLDGQRKLTLDQSVAQIGAPAAWQAGYTGKGVTVAVLDTGIDATHPDLAPQVAGAKNFTDTPAGDQVGHGTHVASTVAGTGAAAAGKYKGVAPGVKLYDGKVCGGESCEESAILAGMEWAATEVKAKVVNLSLGGTDRPELDPLEQAVNRLTAQTGTLFVVAAGNSGYRGAGTIESPGSAEAALTVGAVDKQDRLAWFSSRGPRVGDGGLKPDVTAPGVDIVAAKSKDSSIGDPVGDKYLLMSGTSMATPHTAGAAALLAQQHPEWKAAELKSALSSSAKSIDGQTAFEQGAGRIDAGQAARQTILAEPGGLSFGKALWPHHDDTPMTKKLTYRNLGTEPVALTLAAEVTGPDGKPAPTEAIKLDATNLTVPAGGTGTVTVTSDTRHGGPDGAYSGRVVATGPGVTVRSTLAVEKEIESYDLALEHIDSKGGTGSGDILLVGTSNNHLDILDGSDGTAKVRLPRGDYLVHGVQAVERHGTGEYDLYDMVHPSVRLTADTTLALDARLTKGYDLTVSDPAAQLIRASVGYSRGSPDRGLTMHHETRDLSLVHTAHFGPTLPADQMSGYVSTQWGKPEPDGKYRNTAELIATADGFPGRAPDGLSRRVAVKDLAVVEQTVSSTSDRDAELTLFGQAPGVDMAVSPTIPYRLPAQRRLLVDADPVVWSTKVDEYGPGPEPDVVSDLISPKRTYPARRTSADRVNRAAFTPSPQEGRRTGDGLSLRLFSFGDADGGAGSTAADTATSQLFRDGERIAEESFFGYADTIGLPARETEYKFVTTQTRTSLSAYSTRIDYAFTFRSAGTAEPTQVPLLGIRYQPKVDNRNVAARTAVTVLPVVVDAQPGAAVPKLRKAEVQVSGDGGKTWQAASVVPAGKGRYRAVFRTPAGPAVSLKAKVIDADENLTEQTVIDAYHLTSR